VEVVLKQGAGGSAPKHVEQLVVRRSLEDWDSLAWNFLANWQFPWKHLVANFPFNDKALLLAEKPGCRYWKWLKKMTGSCRVSREV